MNNRRKDISLSPGPDVGAIKDPGISNAVPVERGDSESFRINGQSMDDNSKRSIPDQSIVFTSELSPEKWKSELDYEKYPYWIIVHKTGCFCSAIVNHDEERGVITCHSLNPSPEYQDFEIKLDEVEQLLKVTKVQTIVEF